MPFAASCAVDDTRTVNPPLTVTHSCVQRNGDGFINRALGVTVAHQNNVTLNSQFAVNNLAANVLNAQNNWWGSTTGATLVGPNRINSTAAVNAVPFLHSQDQTCQFDAASAGTDGRERADDGDAAPPASDDRAAATSDHSASPGGHDGDR